MSERALKDKIKLCSESDGKLFSRTFTIDKVVDEGASVICYKASHEKSGKGILKEFYPKSAYSLERRSDGQLVHLEGMDCVVEEFKIAEKEYVEPYEMLLKVRREDENRDLATFIPAFEIYRGCDDDGMPVGTTYIWTPDPELETFEKVCNEIHKAPNEKPERKMLLILTAIESLAKCVHSLHKADMLHRDIKPANFGFIKRGGDTLVQTLSMFDINSVCSVFRVKDVLGTDGYMEPELKEKDCPKANNQSDIYSLGATLYHAIVNSKDTEKNGFKFSDARYSEIERDVEESKLIKASESNSHPRLKNAIVTVLKKSLCPRSERYIDIEDFLKDLDNALYFALPAEMAKKRASGERWILADAEKILDKKTEGNSTTAIQYHLYKYPLYKYLNSDDENINVTLFGLGKYGTKFLDNCLQIGQMYGKNLNVTVFSGGFDIDEESDKELYLKKRPELCNFFNIDDNCCKGEPYGNIRFVKVSLSDNDNKKNIKLLRDIAGDAVKGDKDKFPGYVFIALGEDEFNLSVAEAYKEIVDEYGFKTLISYVQEEKGIDGKEEDNPVPVYVNKDVKKITVASKDGKESAIYPDIERMAFNVHLVWEKNLNINTRAVKADFRKPYYHNSCVANVLSLKYKLYSIGIDLEKCTFKEAAEQFTKKVLEKNSVSRALKKQLMYIEHCRWVVDRLCAGWKCITDLETCSTGVTKDEKGKRHICIVRSRPDNKLNADFKSGDDYSKWDSASKEEIDALDELDRLSVELHRMYARHAADTKMHNILNGNIITEIKLMIDGNRQAVIAFQEWYSCMKDIWNKDRSRVKLYKGYKNSFMEIVKEFSGEKRKALTSQIEAIDAQFFPVLASMEYRDYKLDDVELIVNIPFILTYSETICMAIPYVTGDNSRAFSNVAAATVVNPSRIIYTYYAEKPEEISNVVKSISHMSEYMKRKKLKAAVDFVIVYSKSVADVIDENLAKTLITESGKRIKQVKFISMETTKEVGGKLVEYFNSRQKKNCIFVVERKDDRLSLMLDVCGLYEEFPCYSFDSVEGEFSDVKNCEEFTYITKKPFVAVNDMIAFSKSTTNSGNQPEFFSDYKELWNKYTEDKNSQLWKNLCKQLREYSEKKDLLALFKKEDNTAKLKNTYIHNYLLPYACCATVSKVLEKLKQYGIVEENSQVCGYTSDSCMVTIEERYGNKVLYDNLFTNPYKLMDSETVDCYLISRQHEVRVVFKDLIVENFKWVGKFEEEAFELLSFLLDKKYIINLRKDEGKISFTYASQQIKELLTVEGKLLEVYVYHKLKECAWFDDVVSSCEVNMEDTEVKNEFDAIVTKRFKSLFIESKAVTELQQKHYLKLEGLVQKYGINSTAVLIADTQEKVGDDLAADNGVNRERGKRFGIITVYKPDEIKNIGHTLLRILKGEYEQK